MAERMDTGITYEPLRNLCKSRGISLYQLRNDLNMSPNLFKSIYRDGYVALKTLERIAVHLGVDLDSIVKLRDENTPTVIDDPEEE